MPKGIDAYGEALLAYIRTNPQGMLQPPWVYGLITGGQLRYYFIRNLCPDGSVDEFTIHDHMHRWQEMLAKDAEASINDHVVIAFNVDIKKYEFSNNTIDLTSSGGFDIRAPFNGILDGCSISPNFSGLKVFGYPRGAYFTIDPGVVPTSVAMSPGEARRIIDSRDNLTCVYVFQIVNVSAGVSNWRNFGEPNFHVATRPIVVKLRYQGHVLYFHPFTPNPNGHA